jgi:anti-anti-sigma regulatory factor
VRRKAPPPAQPTVADDRFIADTFATLMPDGRRLVVRGALDIATAPLLTSAFNRRDRASASSGSFVLDLHDLTFVDLYGVRALADVEVQTTAAGYQLRVEPPSNHMTHRTLQFAVRSGWLVPEFADAAPWTR